MTTPLMPDLRSDLQPGLTPEYARPFPGMDSSARAPHEQILHRAHAIWEREGHPENRQLANWLEAESEVMGRG